MIDGVFGIAAKFHDLPLEEKMKISMSQHKTGYSPLGGGVAAKAGYRPGSRTGHNGTKKAYRQSENAALFFRFRWPFPGHATALNQWPPEAEAEGAGVPGFRAMAEAYVEEMDCLSKRLLLGSPIQTAR